MPVASRTSSASAARRHDPEHGLDLRSRRRSWFLSLFAWQPHAASIARRVVLDAGEVEYLGKRGEGLTDRLALSAVSVERSDEDGDVGRRDLVDGR
jgi:hypothetical protein